MKPVSLRLRLLCLTTWAKADTLEFVSEKRKMQDPPHTTGTGRCQDSSCPATHGSTKLENSVPGLSDEGSSEPAHLGSSCSTHGSASPTTVDNREFKETATVQRVPSLCGPDPAAHMASTDGGLMQHIGQKHGEQQLLPESVGQLRRLDRAVCVVCGTIRSQRCNRCGLCQSKTPLHELLVVDTFQDRQRGHQSAAPSGATADQQPPQSSQPVRPGDPLDDSPLPNCPTGHCPRRVRQAATRRASPSLRDGTPAMRGLSIRHGLGRKPRRSHGRSPAEVTKGTDRNSELNLRLRLWETVANQ